MAVGMPEHRFRHVVLGDGSMAPILGMHRRMSAATWFLTPEERGNPATDIDRRGDGPAASYSDGNDVRVLVHGAEYYTRLHATLCHLQPGEWIHFTDWRGDADERLDGPGTEVARVLAGLAANGVHVRGLVWR